MAVTKVFRSGNSQAVRIPRQFQFDTDEVEILRRGDEVVLRKPPRNLARAYEILTGLPDDFFRGGRRQPRRPDPTVACAPNWKARALPLGPTTC